MATAHLFIDYQNLHLTAWECFSKYSDAKHDYLVHPGKFADQVKYAWQNAGNQPLDVVKVTVFRGLPDPRKEGKLNSRVTRQHNNWQRQDQRVTVLTRPLRYPREWPDERAQEKGIDVMMALGIVRCALDGEVDHVLVATRDTDMLPAIEMAEEERPGSVILASWDGQSVLRPGNNIPMIYLDRKAFNYSRDTYNYW